MHATSVGTTTRPVQAATVLLILVATMVPASGPGRASVFCVLCGAQASSEFLLNIALFAPLGMVLAWSGFSLARATGFGCALSVIIEAAQWFIPGRDSAIGDVLANTLGAALGAALFLALARSVADRRTGRPRRALGMA